MSDLPRPAPRLKGHDPKRQAPRMTTTQQGYGTAHQQLRAQLMLRFPVCQWCNAAWSADLHHLDHNPHNRDLSNVVMLCQQCHAAYHARLRSSRS